MLDDEMITTPNPHEAEARLALLLADLRLHETDLLADLAADLAEVTGGGHTEQDPRMLDSVVIRPATLEDLEALRGLLDENELRVDGIAYDDFTQPVLVAERDGEVVGMIQALLGQPMCVITECVVAVRYHDHGYGVRLLQAMEAVMRSQGLTAWQAYTARTNRHAHRILERYGARSTGQGMGYVRTLA